MKGQVWHCKKIKWITKVGREEEKNCLLIFLCFEKNDTSAKISEVVRRIDQLNKKRFGRDSIVIFPFAHLSSNIISQDKAIKLLWLFAKSAKLKFNFVKELPFNKEKEVIIHLYGRNTDVSYFEY